MFKKCSYCFRPSFLSNIFNTAGNMLRESNSAKLTDKFSVGTFSTSGTKAQDRIGQWAHYDSKNSASNAIGGLDHMRNPCLNKDMGFTLEERQELCIHGLLPPRFKTQEEQIEHCQLNLQRYTDNLEKYIYLMGLQDTNERLFYQFVNENVSQVLPLVYTPTVGLACQKYGIIYRRPRGLFITIHDKGHIYEVLKNWPESDVRAIVVTDGERILGLGDLGAYGMGIPVGKLTLYTAVGGMKPHHCLPITLDAGTNRKELLDDKMYIGLRQIRAIGEEYDDFVDEFMQAVVKLYGQSTLIQFEDFGNKNAFRFIERYRNQYCTFNDDIQGTSAVVVAGIFAALRITNKDDKKSLSKSMLLFQGAGMASLGIAELCVMAMMAEGTSEAEARSRIFLVDSKGLIVKDRPEGGISKEKEKFAHPHPPIKTLLEAVRVIKPTILIGASTIAGSFTAEILRDMARLNKRPVIFALSNPTSKSECTAEQAYNFTNGTAIFASGSPFNPVTFRGKTYYPGQSNNSYVFPALALGVICAGIRHINQDLFLHTAESLAELVTEADLEKGSLYPPLNKIQETSIKLTTKIVELAYKQGIATTYPEPKDKAAFIKAQLYDPDYLPATSQVYPWPNF